MKKFVLSIPVSKRKYGKRNIIEAIESDQSINVTHVQHETRMKNETHIKGNSSWNQQPLLSFFRYGWNKEDKWKG